MKRAKAIQRINDDRLISFCYIAPTILLILCVSIIPVVYAFRTSLHATRFGQVKEFIGLVNYRQIFGSAEGWQTIFNSISYTLMSLLVVIPLGTMSAILLNKKRRFTTVFRTVIILPWVLSQTVTALLWKWLLNSNFGPISYVWFALSGRKADFFNSDLAARLSTVLVNSWFTFPIVLILILAALQAIPSEVFEAAEVDGANRRQSLLLITLPMIKPTILTAIVMQSMEYFSMVTLIFVMTAGGPFGATTTISLKAFQEGFTFWHMGLGSAYSIVIFLMNVIFTLLYVRVLRNADNY